MMFYKVITIAFITICSADHRMLLSELLSEQELATPAQPFRRHFIFPMILKYAQVGENSKPSTKSRSVRSARANSMFQNLQYAPLHEGMREYTNPTPTHSTASVEPTERLTSKKTRQYGKSHLEPRTDATDKKCYAPDYKPKAQPSVSRSPGHNAVYRIISEPNVKEKPVKDYVKPIGINLDFKSLTSTTEMPLTELASDKKHKPLTLTKEHYVISPNSLETDLPMLDKSKRYSSHPKFHRLHLNIARVYSPGQVPPKVPAYARAYPDHFGRPPKPEAYMPLAYQDQSKNTMLLPVKHPSKGNYRRRTSILHF